MLPITSLVGYPVPKNALNMSGNICIHSYARVNYIKYVYEKKYTMYVQTSVMVIVRYHNVTQRTL